MLAERWPVDNAINILRRQLRYTVANSVYESSNGTLDENLKTTRERPQKLKRAVAEETFLAEDESGLKTEVV